MKLLVTGSSGLIGSEGVRHFEAVGHEVVGIDNNMRALFFGPGGDTTWCRDLPIQQICAGDVSQDLHSVLPVTGVYSGSSA